MSRVGDVVDWAQVSRMPTLAVVTSAPGPSRTFATSAAETFPFRSLVHATPNKPSPPLTRRLSPISVASLSVPQQAPH